MGMNISTYLILIFIEITYIYIEYNTNSGYKWTYGSKSDSSALCLVSNTLVPCCIQSIVI